MHFHRPVVRTPQRQATGTHSNWDKQNGKLQVHLISGTFKSRRSNTALVSFSFLLSAPRQLESQTKMTTLLRVHILSAWRPSWERASPETAWRFLENLRIELPRDPASLLLGVHLKHVKHLFIRMYVHCSIIHGSKDIERA